MTLEKRNITNLYIVSKMNKKLTNATLKRNITNPYIVSKMNKKINKCYF
jgi:hypothetical protein